MLVRALHLLAVLSMVGCGAPGTTTGGGDDDGGDCTDLDGDGYGVGEGCGGIDCDDTDPGTHSGCGENCDVEPTGTGCPCTDGSAAVECFMADPALIGVGRCAAGIRGCHGGVWGTCDGQVLPDTEICDYQDNDCDGQVDDGMDGECEGAGGDCAEGAEWVYVVTSDDRLHRFRPDTRTFEQVGPLACPAGGGEHPHSMSVDRNGDAWVLYRNLEGDTIGQLFKVSTEDASCQAVDYTPTPGFGIYGMGFAADGDGAETDTLYVGGADGEPGMSTANLGSMQPPDDFGVTNIGRINDHPELTGTGRGELWGFFPISDPMQVRQIDKTTGAFVQSFDLSGMGSFTIAWAFAFWGGKFYIFHQTLLDPASKVYELDLEASTLEVVVPNTGMQISGAGVSTCAPVELI
jgi:hypothetical protein